MTPIEASLIVAAGITAGLMNSVVGAGTLVTFPALLFLGYPPVLANVSNTVGLVPGSVAGAIGYRSTLRGRGRLVRGLLLATSVGGVTGGVLLIVLPSSAFDAVVPWLLLLAAVLAAVQPRVAAWIAARRAARSLNGPADEGAVSLGVALGILATGVYGGYFGAAQGVILLVILGLAIGGPINELNGVKNVLAGAANLVSALLFIAVTEVDWAVAGLVAVGATIGGGLGGRYGRRLPSTALRVLLVLIAVVAAVLRFVG